MTVLFPSWFLALPGLSAVGLHSAWEELRFPSVGLQWMCPALPIPNTPSMWTGVWTLLIPKPAWDDQTSPSSSAGQTWLGGSAGPGAVTSMWQWGHLSLSILAINSPWAQEEGMGHDWPLYSPLQAPWLRSDLYNSRKSQALVPCLVSHLQVGGGGHLALGKSILLCFVSAQDTPCCSLCTCI